MKRQPCSITTANRKTVSKVLRLIRILLVFFLVFTCYFSHAQSKYVKKYRPLADSLSSVYGVPTSIILGVAILESGAGKSRNCKLLNNHFGIVGKNNLLKTNNIKTRYKQYPDSQASYVDFCKLMKKKKFYKKLKHNSDYRLWAEAISQAGYSEIPDYWRTKVLETIRKNKLSKSL